ncbi:GNAT family N-acetyltransferase [Methylococcus geothermalis]|uniref:GNAT family N-acetyltransferase n=1 Tax=Methylococcus geothermalis TaxID=2681310 RepID=A0A858Q934_9GAMM|nr:GNAT family N-acetyltransferase [Methylococcus geothermalis]QJD30216.1 GNAT family N-acetyltransferase [Methylococcus geothermalis]
MSAELSVRLHSTLAEVPAALWNAFGSPDTPLSHEFLSALEETGCLGNSIGWIPMHLSFAAEGGGAPFAAMPAYLKTNSFGEFVFDGAWAEAHARAGLAYYPKWVIASPFTPVTGRRLLATAGASDVSKEAMVACAIKVGESAGVSSMHWLFCTDPVLLETPMLIRRMGCQFHWRNAGYRDFADYLDRFNAKRRKEVKRERRQVREAGMEIRRVPGSEVSEAIWSRFYELYRNTFDKHGNYPALNAGFFRRIGETMGDKIMLVLAERNADLVAAGFFLVGEDTLYGRYWGASEDIPSLHFEVCYYQGLEFCLERGLSYFQPGAQGEHKVSRGFEPTPTWSAHWIADMRLRAAIAHHTEVERRHIENYMRSLESHLPFKGDPGC